MLKSTPPRRNLSSNSSAPFKPSFAKVDTSCAVANCSLHDFVELQFARSRAASQMASLLVCCQNKHLQVCTCMARKRLLPASGSNAISAKRHEYRKQNRSPAFNLPCTNGRWTPRRSRPHPPLSLPRARETRTERSPTTNRSSCRHVHFPAHSARFENWQFVSISSGAINPAGRGTRFRAHRSEVLQIHFSG